MKRMFQYMILTILLSSSVVAYIDPGTTGTIIGGSIWPFIVAAFVVMGAFFAKWLIYPIKNLFRRKKK